MKIHKISSQVFMTVLFSLFPVYDLSAQLTMIEISGDIIADTTWSADTVKVTGDVTVEDDITLTIIPGTYIEFQGYYSLRVKGSLKAEGSAGDTIIFTIKDTTGFKNMDSPLGGWNRIIFDNGSSDYGADGTMNDNDSSVISFCILEYSKDTTQDRFLWGPTPEIGGGAIKITEFSKLQITHSVFRYCRSNDFGGAIHCYRHSDILIKGNYFTHNVAINGGAISAVESNPLIIQNSIINNSCLRTEDQSIWSWESHGGGIFCNMMKPVIKNNDIRYNTARFGPGIACISSNPIIEENTIAYNYTFRNDGHARGGGIYLYENSSAKIVNNLISNNFAFHGGGIGCMLSNPSIVNNLIANNSSGDRGGGVECSYSSPVLTNNTIVNNKAWKGGGLYCIHESYPKLLNCVVWGNEADFESDQAYLFSTFDIIDFNYCIVQDDTLGIGGAEYRGKYLNSFSENPAFISPSDSTGELYPGLSGNWTVQDYSPCINAGSPTTEMQDLPSSDLNGNPRLLHSRIDIGAYEKHISTIIVSDTIKRDTIWIADTVKVMGDLVIADDQTLTITPGTIVKFMGYFKIEVKGTLIARGTERDTILFTVADTSGFSNDTVPNGGWFGIRIDGFDGKMLDNDTTELKWCHIRYAKAYDYSEDVFNSFGGGIHISYFSRMIIDQCYLETNYARRGGAIYLTHADIKIRNSTFENNRAELTGGGIHSANSNPIISNNKFLNNYCQPGGGGMAIDHSNPIIQKNIIFNNESNGILCEQSNLSIFNNLICNNWGSGIDARASSAEITGNIITNNNSGDGGAMNFWDSEDITIYNNTLCNNLAGRGGAVRMYNSHIKLFNNIIFGNRANVGSQIWIWDKYSRLELYNNNIEGDSAAIVFQEGNPEYDGYIDNIDLNPAFSHPTEGAGQEFNGWLADWSLLPVSPCIDKGNKDFYSTGIPPSDYYGNPRIEGEEIDMGAIENQDGLPVISEQPGNQITCEGDTVVLQVVTIDTVNYQWQKNGINIQGANSAILKYDSIIILDEGNYRCIVSNAYGMVNSNQVYLLVNKAPEILTEPSSQWLGTDKPFTFRVGAEGTQPLSYRWKKDGSTLTGKTASEFTLAEPQYSDEGIYTCYVSNTCGEDSTSPATIYLAPQICMVTVDRITGNNLIVWEKNSIAPVTQYNIYRESKYAGIYDLIGFVQYDQLSIYNDSVADPTIRAYLYKITAIDTSGYETGLDLCKTHKTIHLLVTTNPETKATQLDWDHYVGFDYGTYEILRSDTTINFLTVDEMSSSTSTWSDPDPGTGTKFYRVAALRPEPCYPVGIGGKKAESGPYSHSMSNIEDNRIQTGIFIPPLTNEKLSIYPNPFIVTTNLTFNNPEGHSYTLYIMDLSGKVCRIEDDISTSDYILERKDLKEGFYFLELRGPEIYRGKIVVK